MAKKLTSSLNIGDVLEIIRDEAKTSIPHLREACLLVIDPEAEHYTRPLHCAVEKQRINCQLCKRGMATVSATIGKGASAMCFLPAHGGKGPPVEASVPEGLSEIVVPIYLDGTPLAVLDAIAAAGSTLDESDLVVLQDLAELAANVIENARDHWKMVQEKLTVDSMLKHLRPFVPSTVQKIVEKNPIAPGLEKKDAEVSVLFLDVAGYTRISETHTREKLNFIIEKFFSAFLDIINAYGGDINETAGDGLMVIFQGDARDTASGAVSAALEIRRRTQEINEELKNRFPPVEINMGINSGVASVGMSKFEGTTGTRMTFTATGPVTNLAARIAAAAKHGDILVGPRTAQYVQSDVHLHPRGLMEFKNVKEPVSVHSLVRSHELDAGRD
ncbi:MAG: adenylate/guanylate cyclase domain-containing protein [Pseudomonadota bacterium]